MLWGNIQFITARIRRMGEGNVLTRVCPSTNLSVHRGGWVGQVKGQSSPGGQVKCQSSQGGSGQRSIQPGGSGPATGGGQVQPPGGGQVQPRGGVRSSHRGGVRSSHPGGGSGPAIQGGGGSAKIGQHREYLLHGGRYASCVHAGGLSCLTI